MNNTLLKYLGLVAEEAQDRVQKNILKQDAFEIIVSRECNRSARSNDMLALILFDFSRFEYPSEEYLPFFVDVIHEGMRDFDVAGWTANHEIGVLLPETGRDGAAAVGRRICARMVAEFDSAPHYRIQTYPDSETGSGEKDNGESECENIRVLEVGGTTLIENRDVARQKAQGGRDTERFLRIRSLFVHHMPWWKRSIDIAVASLGLIILAPIFLLVALYIKLVSPGPIFFKQVRVGFLGKSFEMYKFRSMHVNTDTTTHKNYLSDLINDDEKPMVKQEPKNCIIPLGCWLRATSLDETPQLINVLRGEMSLIGPRPPIPYEVAEYEGWALNRFDVVPGLTGLWQVSGKNKLSFREMIRLDVRYIKRLGLVQDTSIFFKTFPTLVALTREALASRR